ncbi:type II toxin-antitoxin system RelE/ParE family toxin [Candidatus Fukatsuia symbiotica]|uniref:Type II toxin-antitoxin system mRNA interferase toxin, RelE/StbE family n=1 Tax=Candidatus Fukatsuia symbiotica TaxID=1878942 RepID=A0A2U8I9C8_9GAMM|nr:type II toxin-antitoxin system RelE/ParE family toxin [Candidatus Fukatsuia symbiotica]AWK15713.1 type II toxin-antitoxin system mRNA interferase toxin, RelE/StbE family [Candidatus Fukatsuia symbiotica]MEA9446073.1 type II toxin-antitoxin system RelE/ParE family toxin [Candidatus Fukatsuia symbiotica]
MTWKVELSTLARKNLGDLDKQIAKRILRFLHDRIAKLENPRDVGDALKGIKLGVFWKYRVGDYRIIADIQDRELIILVVRIGNRREVYKR